jgi:hypothetical protein
MTTYSFVNEEFTYTNSGSNIYLQGNTVYTVPSGKIAKVKFDSFHLSQSGDSTFNGNSVLFYSQGTNSRVKHMFLSYRGDTGDASSLHWYNPMDYRSSSFATGNGTTINKYDFTMSSQNQDWSRNGTVDTTPDGNQIYDLAQSLEGSKSLGPDYWYMEAGEVLKVIAQGEFTSAPAGNFYGNARLMVFLEDS